MTRSLLLALLLLTAGCANGRFTYLDHKLAIDVLEVGPDPGPVDAIFTIDLGADRYEGERAAYYGELLAAIEAHPGLRVGRLEARGEQAYLAPRWPQAEAPADLRLELALRHRYSGRWYNYFLGFPGMVPLLPTWYGYRYDLDLHLTATLTQGGAPRAVFPLSAHASFREKNAPRSIAFHYWPTNGVLGTQFALGVFMALDLISYKSQYSTPLLLDRIGPELGRGLAEALYLELVDRLPKDPPALSAGELRRLSAAAAPPWDEE